MTVTSKLVAKKERLRFHETLNVTWMFRVYSCSSILGVSAFPSFHSNIFYIGGLNERNRSELVLIY